jgi:hypothetical protein
MCCSEVLRKLRKTPSTSQRFCVLRVHKAGYQNVMGVKCGQQPPIDKLNPKKLLNLPGTWSSTGNALEALAFCPKDALFVVEPRGFQKSPVQTFGISQTLHLLGLA